MNPIYTSSVHDREQPPARGALLTAEDVAQILRVPSTFVYELARRGELPTMRVGDRYVRFRDDALRRWIEECETEPAAPRAGRSERRR
jgi:excisionase family DNA binding protein